VVDTGALGARRRGVAIGHNGRKRRWGIDLDAMQAEELAGKIRRDLEERLAVLK